ncbi:MAG: PIN domain-containing protein [Pseudomonadota bacterium]|nr:PIN domain-containing protein [Pseudomonadota bacterium]
MIHLDTHVVVWLYQGRRDAFPAAVLDLLATRRPLVSPMVRLELAFLQEIGRLTVEPEEILGALRDVADLGAAESGFERVAALAGTLLWTRDPFDRLIAAHALADDLPLVTKDTTMLANCRVARWG